MKCVAGLILAGAGLWYVAQLVHLLTTLNQALAQGLR